MLELRDDGEWSVWSVISWVKADDTVTGPFPAVEHAVQWIENWRLDAVVIEAVEPPAGYRYSVKETEAYLRAERTPEQ